MKYKRKEQEITEERTKSHLPLSLLARSHANLSGAGQKNRPARLFSFWEKIAARDQQAQRERDLVFWQGVGNQVNDNAGRKAVRRPSFAIAATVALLVATTISVNSSTVMTQAVVHTDSRVLSAAMSVSPHAVGFILNKADVGE